MFNLYNLNVYVVQLQSQLNSKEPTVSHGVVAFHWCESPGKEGTWMHVLACLTSLEQHCSYPNV